MDVVYLLPFSILWGIVGFFVGRFSQKSAIQKAGRLTASYEQVQRKSDEYFQKIEEVIRERELWRSWYNNQASGHDNAQALMMDQIHNLHFAYKRDTGKEFKLDPVIKRVRDQWGAEHGEEGRTEKQQQITEGVEPSDG